MPPKSPGSRTNKSPSTSVSSNSSNHSSYTYYYSYTSQPEAHSVARQGALLNKHFRSILYWVNPFFLNVFSPFFLIRTFGAQGGGALPVGIPPPFHTPPETRQSLWQTVRGKRQRQKPIVILSIGLCYGCFQVAS